MKKFRLWLFLLAGVSFWFPNWAAERLPIAIFPLQNLAGDTNDHWQHTVQRFLEGQIAEVKSVRVLPDSSLDFAFREMQLKAGQALTTTQIQQLGQVIEARRVVWGNYQQAGKEWRLNVQLMNVGTGETSTEMTVASTNWQHVTEQITERILGEIGITLLPDERQKIERPMTHSLEALESYSIAASGNLAGKPISNIVSNLQAAIALDPEFAQAEGVLAQFLIVQNKRDEAMVTAERAIKSRPDTAIAIAALGTLYLAKGLNEEAEKEFREAIRLDPDDLYSYMRLAETYNRDPIKREEAVGILKRVGELEPYDAESHAFLGYIYSLMGKRDQALEELKLAERYVSATDIGVKQMLANAYTQIKDIPNAVKNLESYLALAKDQGSMMNVSKRNEDWLASMKATLTPHFVKVEPPRTFTPNELISAMKARLTPEEYALVINPLDHTSAMDKWAEQLVGSATNDLEKARRIFEGLIRHIDLTNESGRRTALQTFIDLPDPQKQITCQDYTFLYVALARHVGLKAFYVLVDKDYSGKNVNHACAGVLIGDQALIVDPAYLWFGVPHQKYYFEDDLWVVGYYASQSDDNARQAIGLELVPESSRVIFDLAFRRAIDGQFEAAKRLLERGEKLDTAKPKSWRGILLRGLLAKQDGRLDEAASCLRQCLELNPDYVAVHFDFAEVLYDKHQLKEARDEFRAYVQNETDTLSPNLALARKKISVINELLAERKENKLDK